MTSHRFHLPSTETLVLTAQPDCRAEPVHHATHRRLLHAPVTSAGKARIDAIVVPTSRPSHYLKHASGLARELGCPLVALCSGWTTAEQVIAKADPDVEIIAIDHPGEDMLRLPRFATSTVLPARFRRATDTAAKRNLALALARMLRWTRLIFLDDDIEVGSPDDLRDAAGLLDRYDAVGLSIGGFPDNSVVCHAYRLSGGHQESFVGGGALAGDTSRTAAFFPDIYNEDWFYLLEERGLRRLAVTGEVMQAPYDPFRTPDRARAEELGDVLAEGVFWLLDEGRYVREADLRHWQLFLKKRRAFIEHVLECLPMAEVEPAERRRMEDALKAARGRLALIGPELCVSYLEAWRADQKVWQAFVHGLPHKPAVGDALQWLTRPSPLPVEFMKHRR